MNSIYGDWRKDCKVYKTKGLSFKVIKRSDCGYDLILKCPACGEEISELAILQHLVFQAKKEPYENYMGMKKGMEHAKLYKKSTSLKKSVTFTREWKKI